LTPRRNNIIKALHGWKGETAAVPKLSEDGLQRQCITWFASQYPHLWKAKRLHSVPNGGKRNKVTAAILKATGQVRGVFDLHLTIPKGRWAGMLIESKVGKNKLSEDQEIFMREHENEYYCCVVRSLDDFMREIKNYLNTKS